MLRAALLALVFVPSVASAAPFTIGVDFGVVHSKVDSEGAGDRSLGLYGRLGVTSHLSL